MSGYTVVITDRTTDETRRDHWNDLEWVEGSDYLWSDGNFGCDCNRSLFFGRASATPEDEIDQSECGHTRYHVAIEVDGSVVYEDEAQP